MAEEMSLKGMWESGRTELTSNEQIHSPLGSLYKTSVLCHL